MSKAPIRPSAPGELAWIAVRGVGVFVATFVASWWLIGDLTEPGVRRYNLDYVIRPPDLPGGAVAAAGVVSLVLGLTIVVWLLVARARGRSRRELPVVMSLMVAGFVLAGIGRMATTGSVGANIGGGVALMLGGPIVVILLVYALRQFAKMRSPQALGKRPD
jgi:hypothetical protein